MAQTFHGQPLETADHADHAEPSSPTGESTMSSPRSLKTSQVLTPQNDWNRQIYCFKHQTTTTTQNRSETHQVPSSPHRVSPGESRHLGWPAAQWTIRATRSGRVPVSLYPQKLAALLMKLLSPVPIALGVVHNRCATSCNGLQSWLCARSAKHG